MRDGRTHDRETLVDIGREVFKCEGRGVLLTKNELIGNLWLSSDRWDVVTIRDVFTQGAGWGDQIHRFDDA